jgi:hypothetical protein
MANMLQSSQNQATVAPQYYTDYLSGLAQKGTAAADAAQFAGAQPLQTEAFQQAKQNFGLSQPAFQTGQGYVGQAAGQDVTGAAAPYLQAGTSASPLCAAKPLICRSANLNLACMASEYMSPYITSAVNQMSDIAHRNIRQNLSPQATAAAVGSGQFGSQRGAQVLGQVEAQAEQCLNSQIANMLNQGYTTALCAAKSKQSALGNLANTTATAQQAQNQANLTAGSTAATAAANEGQILNTAGSTMGALGTQQGTQNLACVNALATLGGQQQTIAQNAQNYPLTKLASLASLLQGYSIPTSTKTTLCMSPLSGLSAVGAIAKGVACSPELSKAVGSIGSGLSGYLDKLNTGSGSSGSGVATYNGIPIGCLPVQEENPTLSDEELQKWSKTPNYVTCTNNWCQPCGESVGSKRGGLIQARAIGGSIGGLACQTTGGMPTSEECSGMQCCAGAICTPYQMARGGLMKMIASGHIGCMSTKNRGALPSKG